MNTRKLTIAIAVCCICQGRLEPGWESTGLHDSCELSYYAQGHTEDVHDAELRAAVDELKALTPVQMAGPVGARLLDAALAVPAPLESRELVIQYEPGMEPTTDRRLQDLDNQVLQLEAEISDLDAADARLAKLMREGRRQKEEARKYLRDVESERARLVAHLDLAEVAS